MLKKYVDTGVDNFYKENYLKINQDTVKGILMIIGEPYYNRVKKETIAQYLDESYPNDIAGVPLVINNTGVSKEFAYRNQDVQYPTIPKHSCIDADVTTEVIQIGDKRVWVLFGEFANNHFVDVDKLELLATSGITGFGASDDGKIEITMIVKCFHITAIYKDDNTKFIDIPLAV